MISVITKALLYGGIVAASVSIMFRLDNPIIAVVIWVAAGALCGVAEWFVTKERTRKSTERETAVSDHFSKLSEMILELVKEEQKNSDCLDALNGSIKEHLDGCTDKLCGALDKNNAAAREGFEAASKHLSAIEKETAASAEKLAGNTAQAAETLGDKFNKGFERIDSALNNSAKITDTSLNALSEKIAKIGREGFEAASKHLSAIEKETAASAEKLAGNTAQAAETLGDKLNKGFECIGSALDNSAKITDTSLNALSEKIAKIGDVFEKHTDESGKRIDGIMKSIGEINDRVKTVSAKLQSKDWGEELLEEISEISEAMEIVRGDISKCNDYIPTLSTEISEFNAHYRDSLNAMSNEIKSVVKNISDNYKMLKQLSDRYA